MSEVEHKLREFFDSVMALPVPQRQAQIDRLCSGDPELWRRLMALVEAEACGAGFLDTDLGVLWQATAEIGHAFAATVEPALAPEPATIGRYRIVERLGEGGFGVVYLAEQTEPIRRRVALKVIKPGMDSAAVVTRFEAERQALAMMDHPNIATALDAGTTEPSLGSRPYFVMEYVAGEPITSYCDRQSAPISQRLALFASVCRAVQHAHSKGVIHRDIKPSNVLVTVRDGREPSPKIIDFGVAKALHQRLSDVTLFTEHGQAIGTPEYMSPEQAEMGRLDVDTRSDVYSLGVLLYELLTGTRPFDLSRAALLEIARVIREQDPAKPSTRVLRMGAAATDVARRRRTTPPALRGQLARELEWIPLKALRKDRTERYQTADALADDVERYLRGQPLVAGPETAAYRIRKFVRRNTRSVVGAGVVAVGLAVFVVMLGAAWARERRATREAETTSQDNLRLATAERHQRIAAESARDQEFKARARESEALRRATEEAYFANIQAAAAALRSGDGPSARRQLGNCEPALRSWEWRYLSAASDQSLAVVSVPDPPALAAALSPDATTLATASRTGGVQLWIAATGAPIGFVTDGDAEAVADEYLYAHTEIIFDHDGSSILTGDSSGRLRRWNYRDRGEPRTVGQLGDSFRLLRESSQGPVLGLGARSIAVWGAADDLMWEFSRPGLPSEQFTASGLIWGEMGSGGDLVAAGGKNGFAAVWRGDDGWRQILLRGHDGDVNHVALGPHDEQVATAGDDGRVGLWDARTGQLVHEFDLDLPLVDRRLQFVDFTSEVGSLASVSLDGHVRLLNRALPGGYRDIGRVAGVVWGVAMHPNRSVLATGSSLGAVELWDTFGESPSVTLHGLESSVYSVCFSRDGTMLAAGSLDGTARTWDAATPPTPITMRGHAQGILDGAFSVDGRRAATVSADDGVLCVWDARSGEALWTVQAHQGWASCVAISPDGTLVATGGYDGALRVWSASDGHQVSEIGTPDASVLDVEFSTDGSRLISGGSAGTVLVSRVSDGARIHRLSGHTDAVWSIDAAPSGSLVVSASGDGTLIVWNIETAEKAISLKVDGSALWEAAFSPDGSMIAACSEDHTARIWDAMTGRLVHTLNTHASDVRAITFSPDGQMLATGCYDGTAKVWDTRTGECLATMRADLSASRGDTDICDQVAFVDDGSRLVTGGDAGVIRLWEARSGREILVIRRGPPGGAFVTVSLDRQRVLVGDAEGLLTIYDTVPWRERYRELRSEGRR